MVPVVEVVEEVVEVEPLLKARRLGYNLEVRRVEFAIEAPEQFRYGQLKLCVPVIRCWIKYNRTVLVFGHIAAPEVAVNEGRLNFQALKE